MEYRYSQHALNQMSERNISEAEVDEIIQTPQQIVAGDKGRRIYQSLVVRESKLMLLRVVIAEQSTPATVVSVYATTKAKYWSQL